MLILDVKGNYFNQVRKFAYKYNRLDDVIVIELGGKYKYNPLNKPNLKASVLANRLKVILELFSGKTTESYWIETFRITGILIRRLAVSMIWRSS